jgi:NET1-associated nuclear protein 1 (U3 small nucleolar RNA-associated protein 17)
MVSPSGSYLVAIATTKAYCLRLASVKTGFKKFVSPVELTCGAFHPTEDWFVTGDVRGIVRLWYCLSDEGVKGDEVVGSSKSQGGLRKSELLHRTQCPRLVTDITGHRSAPTTTLHWHSHAVSSIAFNSSGTSILSGGQEAVVVIWSVATSGKEFVPRVGGEISALAVRPPAEGREEEIWAGLKDGSVKRLGADGRGGRTIKGGFESSRIQPFTASPSNQHVPIAYHGPTSSLLLPASHPSSLQLYSSTLQTALLELEVAPSNRVSAFADKPIESAHVDRAVLSRDEGSEWLATAESREADEEEGGLEERAIKVWRWDADAKTYSLTTRLPEPHTSRITSLGFSPVPVTLAPTDKQGSLLLLSTSEEGTARLWKEKRIRFKTGRVEGAFVFSAPCLASRVS